MKFCFDYRLFQYSSFYCGKMLTNQLEDPKNKNLEKLKTILKEWHLSLNLDLQQRDLLNKNIHQIKDLDKKMKVMQIYEYYRGEDNSLEQEEELFINRSKNIFWQFGYLGANKGRMIGIEAEIENDTRILMFFFDRNHHIYFKEDKTKKYIHKWKLSKSDFH